MVYNTPQPPAPKRRGLWVFTIMAIVLGALFVTLPSLGSDPAPGSATPSTAVPTVDLSQLAVVGDSTQHRQPVAHAAQSGPMRLKSWADVEWQFQGNQNYIDGVNAEQAAGRTSFGWEDVQAYADRYGEQDFRIIKIFGVDTDAEGARDELVARGMLTAEEAGDMLVCPLVNGGFNNTTGGSEDGEMRPLFDPDPQIRVVIGTPTSDGRPSCQQGIASDCANVMSNPGPAHASTAPATTTTVPPATTTRPPTSSPVAEPKPTNLTNPPGVSSRATTTPTTSLTPTPTTTTSPPPSSGSAAQSRPPALTNPLVPGAATGAPTGYAPPN